MRTEPATVHVAVGVIENEQGDIFISCRHEHLHQGGKWEFPGGKVETSETVYDALCRELREECNIHVTAAAPLTVITHQYPDKRVLLDVWRVTAFSGEVKQREGQPWAWVPVHELDAYRFPDANEAILELIQASV
ncbi:8-oxo-dGTPase [Pseudidiomarina planktonica]|uniref:8-oxo-dGTP diphosphatase n=1 Tax=Pseudidiomarina planktonica TaxID=1323738 RepID=A0A1Y6EJT2_9GAMM|nr:8-oxo-dGTP diphosphatase MutT [Pseudidiomarina planktonica]RUO66051.1 (deoxy)nucleoside triphosphate pyrophosphohydrolase [Pseudidiomarina planktonica]SMQ60832.1 8-oxo-dGTPase [Pseudidiomarina planktonica]